jgi:hypothetical protein
MIYKIRRGSAPVPTPDESGNGSTLRPFDPSILRLRSVRRYAQGDATLRATLRSGRRSAQGAATLTNRHGEIAPTINYTNDLGLL